MTAIEQLRDFLQDRYDTVDGDGACDRPSANDWMQAGTLLEAVEKEHARCISDATRRLGAAEAMLETLATTLRKEFKGATGAAACIDRFLAYNPDPAAYKAAAEAPK